MLVKSIHSSNELPTLLFSLCNNWLRPQSNLMPQTRQSVKQQHGSPGTFSGVKNTLNLPFRFLAHMGRQEHAKRTLAFFRMHVNRREHTKRTVVFSDVHGS